MWGKRDGPGNFFFLKEMIKDIYNKKIIPNFPWICSLTPKDLFRPLQVEECGEKIKVFFANFRKRERKMESERKRDGDKFDLKCSLGRPQGLF